MDKHIALDLDDVILDFVGGLRTAIKKEFDVDIPQDTIKDFNLRPYLDPIVGRSWWAWLRERDWLWPNFPAVDGALGTIERLAGEGYYLEIVTSKPEWADYAVWRWLGKWRPKVQRVTIVRKDDIKADYSDATILVDDKFDNCYEWAMLGSGDRTALLFTRPHNLGLEVGEGPIIRVNNWREVYDTIKELT